MRRLRRKRWRLGRWRLGLLPGLIALSLVPAPAAAQPEIVDRARGLAWGVSENAVSEPNITVPIAEAEAPPPSQRQVRRVHDRDELVNLLDLVAVATVEADACVEGGTSATLQAEINEARRAAGAPDVPEAPARGEVTAEAGYAGGCATGIPAPAPGEEPSASTSPDCESLDPAAVAEGTRCQATLPLWHGRGYARTADISTQSILQAEAVARCDGDRIEVATGAAYSPLEGLLQADTTQPNQQLDPLGLGLARSSAVIFWETNWDPRTNTTRDGSETVWVNGLHIITPTEEIIVAHAEATARCPDTDFPEGGFPRDISLSASKKSVLFGKTFSLSGAVTPATEFETPRRCVENVTVTIRHDPVGGPRQFIDVGAVVTDAEGHFTYNAQADRNAQWLAFIDKNVPVDCALSSSLARPVLVRPLVRLKLSQRVVPAGNTLRMRVTVAPCGDHAGTRIKLKQQVGASMVKVDQTQLDAACTAEFTRTITGESVFQASWPKQDDDHQTGKSRPKVVRTS